MATATIAAGIGYRPTTLGTRYPMRPRTRPTQMTDEELEASRRRRRARAARRRREAARRAYMEASFLRAVLVLAAAAVIGAVAFPIVAWQYSLAFSAVPVLESDLGTAGAGHVADDSDVCAVTEGAIDYDAWDIPDIAGDCPVFWQRADDGSFVNNNGYAIGSENLFGVDVSEHDGTIDWERAKEGGVDFAIIRCGFGTDNAEWDDACWEYNVSECERLDIPYGAYLYSYVTDPANATLEAQHTIRLVEGHSCPLGIWYDIEELSQAEALGYDSEAFGQLVRNYVSEVRSATGAKVGVYTSRSWLDTHMSEVAADPSIPVWCACWTDVPPAGCDYECWQAGAAVIDGFTYACDFDVIFR